MWSRGVKGCDEPPAPQGILPPAKATVCVCPSRWKGAGRCRHLEQRTVKLQSNSLAFPWKNQNLQTCCKDLVREQEVKGEEPLLKEAANSGWVGDQCWPGRGTLVFMADSVSLSSERSSFPAEGSAPVLWSWVLSTC